MILLEVEKEEKESHVEENLIMVKEEIIED